MDKLVLTENFTIIAFEEYIASRHLLMNGFYLPGIILASQVVEKYLKALLVFLDKDFKKVHLDNIDDLKKHLKDTEHIDIFTKDPMFFKMLGDAYKFRYLDVTIINGKSTDNIGFMVSHILFNLDRFVSYIDEIIGNYNSQYNLAVEAKDPRVFDNNAVLNNYDVKEYMERESIIYGVMMNKAGHVICLQPTKFTPPPYQGGMFFVMLEYND